MVQIIGRSWSSIPVFARVLLIIQAVVIVGLATWIYNEYLNNQYLQGYMFSLLDGKGPMLATLGIGGVVGTALIGILLKAGNVLGEIESLSEKVETKSYVNSTIVQDSTPMPVLRIASREPRDEIGQLHGYMRRWKDRSGSGD